MGLLFAALLLLAPGCASIIDGSHGMVQISTSPPTAAIVVTSRSGGEVYRGNAPATLWLSTGQGYFSGELYEIRASADGYEPGAAYLNTGLNGWYWANLLLGGVIGMLIVDPATGAMYDLPREAPVVVLQPVAAPAAEPVTP